MAESRQNGHPHPFDAFVNLAREHHINLRGSGRPEEGAAIAFAQENQLSLHDIKMARALGQLCLATWRTV